MRLNKKKWSVYIDRTFNSKQEAEVIRKELLVTYPPGSYWWKRIKVREIKI